MKECFAITTYCNSDEKLYILNETIDRLKEFNIDIIVHAHYPLNADIQKKVTYYYYGSDNPLLNRYNIYWYNYVEDYTLEYKQYDFAYTVMKQWKEIIKFKPEYDVIHFLNYDSNITKELYDLSLSEIELKNKSVFYENFVTCNIVQTMFFSIINSDFEYFVSILDKEMFLSFPYTQFLPSLEEYLTNKLNENFNIVPYRNYENLVDKLILNEINQILFTGIKRNTNPYIKSDDGYYAPSDLDRFLFTFRKNYNIFIGYYESELFTILYDLKSNLEIEINDDKYIISKDSVCLFKIDNDIKIKINNEIIENDFIQNFINLDCRIYKK